MVVVGAPEKDAQINAHSLISARRNLAGSLIGGILERLNKCLTFVVNTIFTVILS
jgi:D-arabinose 1-dehydrogenase-like Zn-dependent alcohol dehydrogenase